MEDFGLPKELRQQYLERRQQDLVDCQGAVEKGDYKFLMRIGHNLKGNAASYGFDQLGVIGAKLEQAGKTSDQNATQALLADFRQFLASIKL